MPWSNAELSAALRCFWANEPPEASGWALSRPQLRARGQGGEVTVTGIRISDGFQRTVSTSMPAPVNRVTVQQAVADVIAVLGL